MLIITLHGFGSSGEDSVACKKIRKHFEGQEGVRVLTPSYPSNDPLKAIKTLREVIEKEYKSGEMVLIGISLGGFLARVLAHEYDFAKLIMFNPTLQPSTHLKHRIGTNKIIKKDGTESFMFSQHMLDELDKLGIKEDKKTTPIQLFLSKDDAVVPYEYAQKIYKDRAELHIDDKGGHRFKHLNDALHQIDQFISSPGHD
jgi:predicted esterase YcpF (UPF0227 family)